MNQSEEEEGPTCPELTGNLFADIEALVGFMEVLADEVDEFCSFSCGMKVKRDNDLLEIDKRMAEILNRYPWLTVEILAPMKKLLDANFYTF